MRSNKSSIKNSDLRYPGTLIKYLFIFFPFPEWTNHPFLRSSTDEATRIRSRTSQRLQTIGSGGVLLPSPLKSNRVSSALTASATSALNSSQGSNSSGGGGSGSPKTIDDDKLAKSTGEGTSGYKRVTRSTTTTKRWFLNICLFFDWLVSTIT